MDLDAPPRRRWGQNFLADPRAASRIVDALDPVPGHPLLEIGPGRGALTGQLIERSLRIAAVEVDPILCSLLRQRFDSERLTIFEADVLHLPLSAVTRALGAPPESRLAVAGNLPYCISKPVASKLVRERRFVDRAALMFQREVAERITGRPGSRAYGPLSVLVGEAFHVTRLFDLPPSAFRPRPKVVSTLTLWIARPASDFPEPAEAPLRACLAASFAHRRQTLFNNLRAALGSDDLARTLLHRSGLDERLRAEAIPPAGFRALAEVWPVSRGARHEGPS